MQRQMWDLKAFLHINNAERECEQYCELEVGKEQSLLQDRDDHVVFTCTLSTLKLYVTHKPKCAQNLNVH